MFFSIFCLFPPVLFHFSGYLMFPPFQGILLTSLTGHPHDRDVSLLGHMVASRGYLRFFLCSGSRLWLPSNGLCGGCLEPQRFRGRPQGQLKGPVWLSLYHACVSCRVIGRWKENQTLGIHNNVKVAFIGWLKRQICIFFSISSILKLLLAALTTVLLILFHYY